ncbi:MAG: flagellar assembly protein FliW [Desulfobulbaceae bacterium]|jgi:flagellar assembly factor FliW|nr:flagellar assembly protein FliW [Desulfobulbaceae bacterium]
MGQGACCCGGKGTDAGKIVHFPLGIPGFESYTKYSIFHKEEKDYSVYWLESADDPKVTFTLVDPTIFGLNYTITLTDEEQKILEADDPNQLAVLMMLSKPQTTGEKGLSANISGPLVINTKNQRGLQKVLVRRHVDVNIVEG